MMQLPVIEPFEQIKNKQNYITPYISQKPKSLININDKRLDKHTIRLLTKNPGSIDINVTYLITKYSDKDEVKALGAQWDQINKKWFVPHGKSLEQFSKWLPHEAKEGLSNQTKEPEDQHDFKRSRAAFESSTDNNVTYLITKYSDKDEVKALGAQWDQINKKWFVPHGKSLEQFSKWLHPVQVEDDSFSRSISDIQEQESDDNKYNRLGALQVDTKKQVHPSVANRNADFVCIDCGQKVILKRGEIRAPHFAHYQNTSNNVGCLYFDHPSESQLHKDAKHQLASFLQQRKNIMIHWCCSHKKCGSDLSCYNSKICGFGNTQVKYQEGDTVSIEYRDPGGKYVADVAILNGQSVKYIFEIKHTHATVTTRPEPWFEIKANSFSNNDQSNLNSINLRCLRENLNRICKLCKMLYISQPNWLIKIPRLSHKVGSDGLWKQVSPCIYCDREKYNPFFFKGYRQICKICLGNNTDKIKCRFE